LNLARLTLAVLAVFTGFGCGVQQVVPSSAQRPKAGSNSVLIRQPFEEAWSRAIPQIGKSFFVINNIDKSSGILNVSYTGDPETYVDCGTIHSELGVQRADFPVAKTSQQWIGPGGGIYAASYTQHVTLDGRMNIVFERVSSDSTRVTVNARYVVTRKVAKEILGSSYPAVVTEETAAFNSGGEASLETAVCRPNGKFESEALAIISPANTDSSIH
jgi:hypothetical protein